MFRPLVCHGVPRSVLCRSNLRFYSDKSWPKQDLDAQKEQEARPQRASSYPDMSKSLVSESADPVRLVRAHAGKSAVIDTRRRSREGVGKSLRGGTKADDPSQSAARADHASPKQPLPELRTFSQPSTSFNASSWVAPGVAPPLAGQNAAGVGEGYQGRPIEPKLTALILPGQGSQYVTMSRDLYDIYPAARRVWEEAEYSLTAFIQGRRLDQELPASPLRGPFEEKLQLLSAIEPSVELKPGWLLNLVFSGNQLELTRAENAQPAILACTLAMLAVLREEFNTDLVKDQVHWAAGHGSGTYAALVASGSLQQSDALRALRYRGQQAMQCLENHPVLFPPGCVRPASVYETWGFANAGAGKGSELLMTEDADDLPGIAAHDGSPRNWKGTQVSAIVVRPGRLQDALKEVESVQQEIQRGDVQGIAPDEFVAVSNINSRLQIVISGTRVGVMYACDRLRFKMIGARAVNLPVAGPFHTSMVTDASKIFESLVEVLPINEPSQSLPVVSSRDGQTFTSASDIREDLGDALDSPVHWIDTISRLVGNGVQRFICLGPGRACAHQLSKELACYEKSMADSAGPNAKALVGTLDEPPSEFEVWSVSTSQGMEQLVKTLEKTTRIP
ncbi:[acyl-carrier-protein] S-malonyltransferase [Malassezia psittaci]|uniref:[acyl-carrier-protein] S-malonyltransferase n=1 Tax=Malassezia psittaci TaxID=1821823 RepID=A0AAF0FCG1_9BASI|nr:[acyl-carrier-protein] S-malonyltransferase [Malassezia psittaci]